MIAVAGKAFFEFDDPMIFCPCGGGKIKGFFLTQEGYHRRCGYCNEVYICDSEGNIPEGLILDKLIRQIKYHEMAIQHLKGRRDEITAQNKAT